MDPRPVTPHPPSAPPAPQAPPIGGAFTRLHLAGLASLAILTTVLGWWGRSRELLVAGDEPIYLTLSHSLAAGGYHDEFLVGAPRHVQYPPGMPALLLMLRTLVGPDPDVARAVNLLLVGVTLVVMADLVRRISTPSAGLLAAALIGLNPVILMRAGTLYAETLMMAALAVALWAAGIAESRPGRRWVLVALGAAAAGFLARVSGLAGLAGVAVGWGVRRRWRAAALAALAGLALVTAWFRYVESASRAETIARSYAGDLGNQQGFSPLALVARLLENARIYLVQELPKAMSIPTIPGTPIDNLLVLGVLGGLGLAGLVAVVRHLPTAGGTLLAHAAILGYWPWPNERFLGPVLPVIFVVLTVGADRIGRLVGGGRTRFAAFGLLGLTLLPAFGLTLQAARNGRACAAALAADRLACYPEEHRGYVEMAGFIRDSLPAGANVLVEHPAMLHHLSGRQGFPDRLVGELSGGDDLGRLLGEGLRHVLLGPARDAPAQWRLTGASLEHCRQLRTLARYPGALLLGGSSGEAPGSGACQDVTAYLGELEAIRAAASGVR